MFQYSLEEFILVVYFFYLLLGTLFQRFLSIIFGGI